MNSQPEQLRERILSLVAEYYQAQFAGRPFIAGESPVPVSGRVFDQRELQLLVDSALEFWLTAGRFAERFEREFARYCGLRSALLVNSGSSANLLAVACLTSPKLGARRLQPGDEVITTAAGFPTTVNPILQHGLRPVFVDIDPCTLQARVDQLEVALSERTRAVILPHTLGNPFDAPSVQDFARSHDLWMIEDCCDAVGARVGDQLAGTFGDLATVSFYPAHHITMGEGGCVLTDQPLLRSLVESFRDWGRDCWCAPGRENTCGKRFDWRLGELPCGYDHKYIYSHIGYNLKLTDLQAAVGLAQLEKLPEFLQARRRNFGVLYELLRPLEEVLQLPQATPGTEPSWFGFPMAVRPSAAFSREALVRHLDSRRVATRLLFGGNLVRQPAYAGSDYRVIGDLGGSDFAMRNVFWIGLYPGLTPEMLEYSAACIREFVHGVRRA